MASMQDPFYVVKDEVQQSLGGITALYDRWKDLLQTTNTAANDEFKWTTNELKSGLRSIEWDMNDLEETVRIVESNKTKFKIDDSEVQSRKDFIQETKNKVTAIKDALQDTSTKGKMEKDQREVLLKKKPSDKFSKMEKAIEDDNEDFIKNQQSQQLQIMKKQDDDLTRLSHTVENLKEIGSTITTTLEEQTDLIVDLETEVDKADSGLKGAIRGVNKLIDSTKDSTQWCVIIILILALVGLIILVFYV